MNNPIDPNGKKWIHFFLVKEGAPFKLTGREINSKLVISQNKHNGDNSTIVMASRNRKNYFFIPFSDIYYDCEHKELIMPKMKPIHVAPSLAREIVPSRKYRGYYVFSPHSDVDLIFKEIMMLDGGEKKWILAYNQIVLYEYVVKEDYPEDPFDDYKIEKLSKSQIVRLEKEDEKRQKERDEEAREEARSLLNELYEEAGYDFMDRG